MKPTILVGDYLAVWTHRGAPQQGKVYIYRHPVTGMNFVGRLIAFVGDRPQMVDGALILNGTPVPQGDDCIKQQFQESLPNGVSRAQRGVGFVHAENLVGIPSTIVFSAAGTSHW